LLLVYSQFYVNVNGGYSLGVANQTMIPNYEALYDEDIEKFESVYGSLGKGANFGLNLGYMFNNNIGIDIGFSFLMSDQIKSEYKEKYTNWQNNDIFCSEKISLRNQMIRINPSLIIAAGFEKVEPYAKFGVIIGLGHINLKYTEEYFINSSLDDQMIEELKLDGGIAFGISSAAGLMFHLSDIITIFSEFNLVSMSYAPEKGKITKYSKNGIDLLPDLNVEDKEIDFVDSYTYDYDNPPSSNEPRKMFKIKFPYSGIGLNVGIRFSF
jgi:opacity protein-like surface antigen